NLVGFCGFMIEDLLLIDLQVSQKHKFSISGGCLSEWFRPDEFPIAHQLNPTVCHELLHLRCRKGLDFDLPLRQQTSPGLYKSGVNVPRVTHQLADAFRHSVQNVLNALNIKKTGLTETVEVARTK